MFIDNLVIFLLNPILVIDGQRRNMSFSLLIIICGGSILFCVGRSNVISIF